MVFDSVLCFFNKFIDHRICRGDAAQALALWWHPVASNEVLDVLHWVTGDKPRILMPDLLAILMAMQIRRYNAKCIA